MNRTSPLQRKTRIARVSPTHQRVKRARSVVYAATRADTCFSCGSDCCGELTPSHILTQGQHKQHRLNPRNIVWECWATHCLWENNKTAYARAFPAAFAEKMERMRGVDAQAYAVFRMKHAHLFS